MATRKDYKVHIAGPERSYAVRGEHWSHPVSACGAAWRRRPGRRNTGGPISSLYVFLNTPENRRCATCATHPDVAYAVARPVYFETAWNS